MIKICNRCKLPKTEYYKSVPTACIDCVTAANRKWWNENHADINKRQMSKYREFRLWFDSLKDRPCSDCGAKFPPYCMDWDHVGDKKFNLGRTQSNRKAVLEEIAKCELVCSNCHRIRTHTRKKPRGK
jgi:hypothetical protein